jgi:tRNA(Ile)-lysidine synthase
VEIQVPGVTLLPDGSHLVVEPFSSPTDFPHGDYEMVAAVSGAGPLYLRPARPGDRIRPFGSRGRRLIFDLLSEAGVPRHLRTRSWVLESPGRILWVLGHRPAEETRVLPDSPEVYQFRWDSVGSRTQK